MKIVVCIKQVPASSNVQIDPVTGILLRDGKETKMNPYDLYAIEAAMRIKEATNASIVCITMGPPSAISVLKEALAMGCDDAVLISDRALGGADVVATSYTLSNAIKCLDGYDIIICGKQTTDGDTAQVGPEVAECLNIPHVCYVNEIISVNDKSIHIKSDMDDYIYESVCNYPVLLTIDNVSYTPRLPSYKRMKDYENYSIKVLSIDDFFDKDKNHYGLLGSPTSVDRMFNPEHNLVKRVIDKDQVSSFIDILKEGKFI